MVGSEIEETNDLVADLEFDFSIEVNFEEKIEEYKVDMIKEEFDLDKVCIEIDFDLDIY